MPVCRLAGTVSPNTSIDLVLGLVRKLFKSADKHNRSKQHKNISVYNGFLSKYIRRYYEHYGPTNCPVCETNFKFSKAKDRIFYV